MGFSRALCRRLWLFLKMGHTAHPDKFALSVSGITAGRGTFSKRVTPHAPTACATAVTLRCKFNRRTSGTKTLSRMTQHRFTNPQPLAPAGVQMTAPAFSLTAESVEAIAEAVARILDERAKRAAESDRRTPLMSLRQTAERLGVSRQTLHKWEAVGYLKPLRYGRRVRYRRCDVEDVAEAQEQVKARKEARR